MFLSCFFLGLFKVGGKGRDLFLTRSGEFVGSGFLGSERGSSFLNSTIDFRSPFLIISVCLRHHCQNDENLLRRQR
jgi:hypothetical protein